MPSDPSTARVKVLVATHYFSTHKGGVEIVAGELNRELITRYGYQLTWMASDASPPPHSFPGIAKALRCSNITERLLGFPMPLPLPSAFRDMWRQVRNADVLIVHDSLYLTNVLAAFFARRRRIPVVIVQHIGLVPYANVLLRLIMKVANAVIADNMLARADSVVFISGLTHRFFSKRVRFRREPALILNGLREDLPDSGAQASEPTKPQPIREALFVGRFVEKKGLDVIRRLAQRLPNIRWRLCGWGAICPESWGLSNIEVARNIGPTELARYYRSADLLVLPSTGEGLPLVVQEALCFGCPVISSDELLVADPWLRDEITTAPVDLGDPEGTTRVWANVIGGMSVPKRNRLELAAKARERYSWAAAGSAYNEILTRVVNERQTRS